MAEACFIVLRLHRGGASKHDSVSSTCCEVFEDNPGNATALLHTFVVVWARWRSGCGSWGLRKSLQVIAVSGARLACETGDGAFMDHIGAVQEAIGSCSCLIPRCNPSLRCGSCSSAAARAWPPSKRVAFYTHQKCSC